MKAIASSQTLTDTHWIDGDSTGQPTGLINDFSHVLERVSGWFAAIDVQYVDPWERKRR